MNHLNPKRRCIASAIPLPSVDYGEDVAWSKFLIGSRLLKPETAPKGVRHECRFQPTKPGRAKWTPPP